ncbi:hypothetical protein FD32_GL000170 [Limosilactobacillus panis DSM 6035]|uniref:NADP-dependent oxidoreductase domain-containing protein n=1 Tax=Limosilactobacillus panis DSM 6035 TaxID=1423782 RepID=A0A0R1XBC5_9LACO|nr:hypothetical protein FD32_GL000170 [Limosilactobacillus panis DSM 6035]
MKEVKLNNGIIMPAVGYGTYQTAPEETTKNVLLALQTGYRLIDTAQYYGNEAEVGEALTESGLARLSPPRCRLVATRPPRQA